MKKNEILKEKGYEKCKSKCKNIFKNVAPLVAGILLFTNLNAEKKATGEIDYYNQTKIEKTIQKTENNLIYKKGNFSIGWNSILTKDKKQDVLSSSLGLNENRIKVYLHVNPEEEKIESKLNLKVGESTYVDIGGGNEIFHTGFLYGFFKPFGFGLNYIKNGETTELGGMIWKYWKNGLFTGIKKSNNQLTTIISKPSDNDFAIRYFSIIALKKDFNFNQLILGKSRPGYYGLNFGDSWCIINDMRVIGQDPINIANNPLRYIVPPTAWLIKDYGASLKYTRIGTTDIVESEIVKYIDDYNWISVIYKNVDGNSNGIGLNIGRTSDNLKFNGGIFYDIENKNTIGNLQIRLKF